MGATAGCPAQTEFPLTGRLQGSRKGSIGQPARHQGGTRGRKEPFRQTGRHQGGTRETCSTGLPIESRFWKGAGFCLTFNTISMANGPVRGKSWGGRHGRLPSRQLARHQGGRKGSVGQLARHQGGTREAGENHLDSLRGTREAGKDQLDGLRGTREAPRRQERTIWTASNRKEPFRQLGRHQGGRKGSIGQSVRHQGGTREAGKNHLDSLEEPGSKGFGMQ